jgi:ABC-type transport system involved in multi-copper enzyme maturation permease subunit
MNKIFAVAAVVIKELYRRKDFYVLFILTVLITLLMASVNFFHDDKIVRFMKEICLILIWLSALVIAVTTAARQIPMERENRTIFPLLAKPIARWQVLVGKYLGCWLASGAALLVFYMFFALVSASREHSLPLASYFQALWLHWQMLGIVIAITMLGSVALSPAANITIVFIISVGILSMGKYLNMVAQRMAEPSSSLLSALYFVIPHLEFFDERILIIHGWTTPIPWVDILLASLYAFVYAAFFLLAACLVFRRKALN